MNPIQAWLAYGYIFYSRYCRHWRRQCCRRMGGTEPTLAMALDSVDSFDVRIWIWIVMFQCPDMSARISGVFILMVPLFMKETRSSVLLTRLAKKLRKETGDQRYRARVEDERASLRNLIYISCTRPVCKFVGQSFVNMIAHSNTIRSLGYRTLRSNI